MDVRHIIDWLGADETDDANAVALRAWVHELDVRDVPDITITLPDADTLPVTLLRLTVPHRDIAELVTLRPSPERAPEIWWLLERMAAGIIGRLGVVGVEAPPPPLPERVGPVARWFPVYLVLAVLPHLDAWYRQRGITDEVGWLTLTDVGRAIANYHRRGDTGPFNPIFWLTFHLTGALYQLGRLQFERTRIGERTGRSVTAAGLPYGDDDPCLAVHIPGFIGPLTPAACDASFTAARTFFARHFPDETPHIAVCRSWLLDEQLADYLPETSNILQFQRRFRPVYRPEDNDADTVWFVFGRAHETPLDELPQDSTLERAIVGHIRAGHHWRGGMGWLEL